LRLASLTVRNFRNLQPQSIRLSPGINLFSGRNGQGKTNLLEAAYLLGFGKSFRTRLARDCIRHGERESLVHGLLEEGTRTRELQVRITPDDKELSIQGKTAGLEAFVGSLHLLAFTSEHLQVVRGAPAERRSFLDRAMITVFPAHMRHLASFGRAVKQRNRVLAAARERGEAPDEAALAAWDEALVCEGSAIVRNRMRYVARMKEAMPAGLFGDEAVRMHYLSTAGAQETELAPITEAFRAKLERARGEDAARGSTSIGPHRDDLLLYIGGKPLAGFGSAGQQRSVLLSLYFAQMEIHRATHGHYPVLLVDDAEAELDERRLEIFFSHLAVRAQTLLTTAKEGMFPPLRWESRRFSVCGGQVLTA